MKLEFKDGWNTNRWNSLKNWSIERWSFSKIQNENLWIEFDLYSVLTIYTRVCVCVGGGAMVLSVERRITLDRIGFQHWTYK